MGFPDRIERTVEIAHPPAKVWAAPPREKMLMNHPRRDGNQDERN